MNYNKLKYFYEIAKIQNLTHASKVLFVSQSSLSKAIADLEKDFGTELFIRTNNSMVLTEAGKELFSRVSPLFSEEDELYKAVRSANKASGEEVKANLKIGFMAAYTSLLLPDFVKVFSANHPNINVQLNRYNKVDLLKKLNNKSLDMAYVIYSIEEITSEYQHTEISEHRLSIIARDDHPLANRKNARLNEFQKDHFLMHGHKESPNEYENAIIWCKRSGFLPQITGEYDYVETVLTMVASGMGVALLSDASPYQYWKRLVNIPLENAPIIHNGIIWREDLIKNNQSKAAGTLFRDEYMNYAREQLSKI